MMGENLHGNVVRDDGLLLQLKLLEDIRLQDLANLFSFSQPMFSRLLFAHIGTEMTHAWH